ncbi:adenylate/guanylate cyclase domain-containing protein [bacterium]|nr:adenylate/guanylate cyclase domain-containing protein [bacterium]
MKKLKNKWFYINSALIYFVFVVIALVLSYTYLEPNFRSFFISNFSANKMEASNIVEIIIDDASISKYPWPWSKYMYVELLDYFSTYSNPKLVALDMIPPDINPMSKSDMDYINKISKMDNLVSGFIPAVNDDNSSFVDKFREKYALNVNYKAYNAPADYMGVNGISDYFFNASHNLASVKISPNTTSGLFFSATNVIKIGDSYYPSLPLKMYLLENNTNDVIIDDYSIIVPKTGLKIPHNLITKGSVETNIKYYDNISSKSDFTHYAFSAYKIIDSYRNLKAGNPQKDDIPPTLFDKNTVIFIGVNISGPSADVLKTPKDDRHPGVDIQASMYDNIVNDEFLKIVGWNIQLLTIFLLSLLTFIFILRFKFLKSLLSVMIADVVFFILVAALAYNGYILSFIAPIIVQLVTLIFGYSFKFISENRNKEKIKQAMGKYLSQDIMKNVVSNIDELKLGGKKAVVTVLFSDIRGFTSLSEKMSAEEVSMILNEYFAEMEPIITKYNGVINKFIGDAVMAIFGEPIQDINHAENAVKCAYEMLKKVEYLREKWLFENKPKIEIGVGINTGEVFIGNIGTETRMEYTVIGDTVNLASRIESYNKVYKTNLLVSSSTYSHISDIADVIKISEVQIRGKAKKMNIYEVLRIDLNHKS